jgi:hypothetical protein
VHPNRLFASVSLYFLSHRVATGAPAKFTTPSHPRIASVHSNFPVIVSHLYTETFGLNADLRPSASLACTSLLLLVKTLTLVPSCNNFSVNFLPTNPVAPEMATVKGASRSFFLLLVVVVLVLVVSVVSSSAFAAFADDDDVRLIRFRCFPEEEEDKEDEEAQKRPPFKARRRIDGGENDAPLLDIIIIIVLL